MKKEMQKGIEIIDLEQIIDNNVTIVRDVSIEDYGKVMVFADLYGNKWDLIQPN